LYGVNTREIYSSFFHVLFVYLQTFKRPSKVRFDACFYPFWCSPIVNFLSTIAVVVITYYTSLIRLATTAELMVNYQRLFYSEKLIAAERWCIDLIAYISINT
jgi:hypothetical protein